MLGEEDEGDWVWFSTTKIYTMWQNLKYTSKNKKMKKKQ